MRTTLLLAPVLLQGALSHTADTSFTPHQAAEVRDRSGFVPIGEGRIWYAERGAGPAVVLIHGGNLDSRMWDRQVQALAPSFRVIRYDVRPYGRSSAPTAPYHAVDDLRALLDHLKIERAHLVGLSLGGRIAIDFSLRYPARADRVVVSGPGLTGFQWSPDEAFKPMAEAARQGNLDKAVELWLRHPYMAPAMSNPALANEIRQIAHGNEHIWKLTDYERFDSPPAMQRLAEIKVPLLVLVGERDVPDIHAIVKLLEDRVKGARVIRIPRVGHMLNMEAPDEFNRLIREFLSRS
jgi:3-oxoadipate enol-lactonase